MSQPNRILIYLLRRDLRLADNPIFNELARLNSQSKKPFTHLLPVFVFPAQQLEVSGFVTEGEKSPYPEARSKVGGFWRCGRLRSKFLAESVWDIKQDLENIGSGLTIRAGTVKDAVSSILEGYRGQEGAEVHGLWMTKEDGWEEQYEERDAKALMDREGKEFKLWTDEKYFVDDRDLPFKDPRELKDVFTAFRNQVEPLREAPRKQLPKPDQLPPLPDHIPAPAAPFKIPDTLNGVIDALLKPLPVDAEMPNMPQFLPEGAKSAHPFKGGSKTGIQRIQHLIESGSMTSYKDTRNGLIGQDFSTKLSAWLALGSITARQVHWLVVDFEDGKTPLGKSTQGYGKGENKGTAAVRFELLWRDYMRLCTQKFGTRLFMVDGYRCDKDANFKFISSPFSNSTAKKNSHGTNDEDTRIAVERFVAGRTGTGLIDASQRELFLTGYTSNRTRQNVASYLSKHLGIDWRLGAEWYESCLIDYDVHSNWGNWQYVAGVGNDPRGAARVFNPVKQAVDYDSNGDYVRMWLPELRGVGKREEGGVSLNQDKSDNKHESSLESLMGVFQAWRIPDEEKERLGLKGVEWVEKPLIKINFSVNRRGGGGKQPGGGGGGGGGGGRGGRGGRGGKTRGQRGGRDVKRE